MTDFVRPEILVKKVPDHSPSASRSKTSKAFALIEPFIPTNQRPAPSQVYIGSIFVSKIITDHLFTKYLNDHRPRHFKWYQDTTIPDLKFLPDRRIDVQLRLLRFRAYTLSFTNRGQPTNCGHCQAEFNPIHYLVGCPAYPTARRLLLDHLSPDQHSWTDYQQAALLIRKATILPAILSKLIAKDPYRLH